MDLDEGKARTRATYNLAGDHFDDAPLAFWERIGARTVERLALAPGNRVLDVCCGSGATAIPAARAVGPFGTVLGVDLAQALLDLASRKAGHLGLKNVQFRCADIETMGFPRASCDAVICQFGIFFLPDMEATARQLWGLVAPRGALAITTWGARVLEPAMGEFWKAVGSERPDLVRVFNPWERLSSPAQLTALFSAAGTELPAVEAESSSQSLAEPADFWTVLMGSGTRHTIEALGAEAAGRVRDVVLDFIERERVDSVETNVVFGVARRPNGPRQP